ncbi:Hypothetical Protein FCC1311_038632 [Hondaea fermentalgiana]|uniref:Uncharacterized protein n=1 Tax=Hondaea fermentalgiana TaxID=2315210 RepID=A0A2R5G9C7_9STRA|nr:Hypothetical Protein FCC1311_038632 [Hondaea fermentalgiana]|eukprot:GBG27640.1 Hypothetical Protein FCC1311_038632 [Hondaea fermentalgiana]
MLHDALEERFRAMEVRLASFESEKRQDEARIRDLTASLAEIKARTASKTLSQRDAASEERIAKLERTLGQMSKHVGSLEDLLIDRDDRIKNLAHQVQILQNQIDNEPRKTNPDTNVETAARVAAETVASEVARVSQSLVAVKERVEEISQHTQKSLAATSKQTEQAADRASAVAAHVNRSEKSLGEWKSQVTMQFERLEGGLSGLHKALDAQASRENHMQTMHQATIEDVRETMSRHAEKTNDRLEKHAKDVRERLASELDAARHAQADARTNFNEDLARFKDSFDLDRSNLEVRMQKLFDEMTIRSSQDDARIAELRADLDTRTNIITEDLRHEESVRMDSVRRVHEELTEQIESLQDRVGQGLQVGEGIGAGPSGQRNVAAAAAAAEKLGELEEVVRAEVRARMRHEAKAREHVTNTVQTLQVQIDKYRRSGHDHHEKLRRHLEAQASALQSKVQQDIQHISDKLAEFAQARQLTNAEALERVSLCEAKLAKRTAAQYVEVDKVRADLEKLDETRRADCERFEVALTSARTHFETHLAESLQVLQVQLQDAQTSSRHELETHAEEVSSQLHDAAHRAQIVEQQNEATFKEHRKLLEDAVNDLSASIERVAASQASKEALGNILDDIERREVRERQEALEREKEEQLRSELQQGLADLEQSFSQFYEDVESKATALEGLVYESQQSSYQYVDQLRTQLEAETEQRAADQSTVRLAVDQLCGKMDNLEGGALRQTQEDTTRLQVELVLERLLAGVAEQALVDEQEHISEAAEAIYESIHSLANQVESYARVSAQVEAKVSVLQKTVKLADQQARPAESARVPANPEAPSHAAHDTREKTSASNQEDSAMELASPDTGTAGPSLLSKPSRDSIILDGSLDLSQAPEADLGDDDDEDAFAL